MAEPTIAQRRATLIAKRESLVTLVKTGNRTVEYDLSMVEKALQQLNVEEAAAGGRPRVIRQIKTSSVKDL